MFIFSFKGAGQYWGKSVLHFFGIASSFHALKSNEASFQVERKSISFHDKAFWKVDLKFPYHDLKTNALSESVSQWRYQLIDEEIVIQVNQQLLRYFQSQTKLQQSLHHSWMSSVQQVDLVISQHESKSSQVIDMKSKSKESLNISVIPESRLLIPIRCIEQSSTNIVFKDVFESLTHDSSWKEFNCHVDNRLFTHRRKLFILRMEETGHRIERYHGQHDQGHHMQGIDRMYWYIVRSRWKEREFYPHQLFV